MKPPGRSNWQRRRSEFNHQWLKNRFLSALDAASNLIRGRIRGTPYLQELIEIEIAEWQERREELSGLLGDFENEMSPRQFFDLPPLSECEPSAKGVLADLMHELWLARYSIVDLLESARSAAAEVNEHYELLRVTAPMDAANRVRSEFAARFEEFSSACRLLSKVVEKFPNHIRLT